MKNSYLLEFSTIHNVLHAAYFTTSYIRPLANIKSSE